MPPEPASPVRRLVRRLLEAGLAFLHARPALRTRAARALRRWPRLHGHLRAFALRRMRPGGGAPSRRAGPELGDRSPQTRLVALRLQAAYQRARRELDEEHP